MLGQAEHRLSGALSVNFNRDERTKCAGQLPEII